jgi:hypothetical protein
MNQKKTKPIVHINFSVPSIVFDSFISSKQDTIKVIKARMPNVIKTPENSNFCNFKSAPVKENANVNQKLSERKNLE